MRENRMGKCSAYFCSNCFFGVKLLIKSALLLVVNIDYEPVNCTIGTFCDSQFQFSWTYKLSSQSCVGGRMCIQDSLIHWNVHFGACGSVWLFWPCCTDEKKRQNSLLVQLLRSSWGERAIEKWRLWDFGDEVLQPWNGVALMGGMRCSGEEHAGRNQGTGRRKQPGLN